MAEHVEPGEVGPQPFCKEAFYEALARMLPGRSPQAAAEAVLCTLSQKLPGGVVVRMERELPPDLAQLMLRSCPTHKQANAVRMNSEEFYERVGAHLGVDAKEAQRITTAVFRALHPYLSRTVYWEVLSELPKDPQDLWNLTRAELGLA